jgi:protein-tyrosine-phosphatase
MKCAKFKHTTTRPDLILNVCKDCKTEIVRVWIEEQKKILDDMKLESRISDEQTKEKQAFDHETSV